MSFSGFAILSSGGHFVLWSGIIIAISVEGHSRNISVKFFRNRAIGLGGDVF